MYGAGRRRRLAWLLRNAWKWRPWNNRVMTRHICAVPRKSWGITSKLSTVISGMLKILSSTTIPGRFDTWSWTRKTGGWERKSWWRRNGSNESVGVIRESTLTSHARRLRAARNSTLTVLTEITRKGFTNIMTGPDTGFCNPAHGLMDSPGLLAPLC